MAMETNKSRTVATFIKRLREFTSIGFSSC